MFSALKGKGIAKGLGIDADVELAVAEPNLARIEFEGTLGVRLGLLLMNPDWIELFVSREHTLYRFPAPELKNDTLRRERFLKLLPLPLQPEVFVDALLSRVSLPKNIESLTCTLDENKKQYRIRIPAERGGRWIWVDAVSFMPIQSLYFDGILPYQMTDEAQLRPSISLFFSRPQGQAPAVLARRIEIFSGTKRQLIFDWSSAESFADHFDADIFDWRPPASISVREY